MNRLGRLAAAVAAAALLLAVGIAVGSSTVSQERDSAFVRGGDGAEVLLEEAHALGLDARRLASSPAALDRGVDAPPGSTVVVVARPPTPYTAAEAETVAAWVARGGHLLVADDTGQAHTLLAPYGITFERVRVVAAAGDWEATAGREAFRIAPPSPSAILVQPGVAAQVLATSPPGSFLDRDGDGVIGASDPQGAFPLAATLDHGRGRVVALADADLLAEAGGLDAGNRAFLSAVLADALPAGGLVLIDESRLVEDPLLAAVATAVGAAAAPGWRAGLATLAIVLLAALLMPATLHHWAAHRFRPDRFRRRATLQEAGGPEPLHPGGWTARGAAAALLAGALGLGAVLWGSQQAAVAAGGLLVALGLAAAAHAPRLRATRRLSADRLDESQELSVDLAIESPRNVGDLEFLDRLPETFALRGGTNWFRAGVAAGQPLQVSFQASPALRGPHEVGPLLVRAADPLGLRVDQAEATGGTSLRVNPRSESVRKLPFRTRIPSATLGPHLVNRAGDGSEFHALRTYQSGDSFRSVNWKASARSRSLMVNQRVHESMTRLTLFLDARAISGAGPASRTPLAHGCRTALSIASGALRMRDRLRVVVYGDGATELPPMPGSRQLHAFTDLLASLDAKGGTSFGDALESILPTLRPGTPILLASGLEDDPSIPEALRKARGQGLQPVVVASPLGLEPVDEPGEGHGPEPGAAAIRAQRAATVAAIQALGIPVFDAVENVPLDLLFRTGAS